MECFRHWVIGIFRYALFAVAMYRKGEKTSNKIALKLDAGNCHRFSFVGLGLLGFAHTLPQVNMYTHGTLVDYARTFSILGAYAMIVLAIISYTMPLTGRKLYDSNIGVFAFWLSNIGMLGMTMAFNCCRVA